MKKSHVFVTIDPGSTSGISLVRTGFGDSPHERILNGELEVDEISTENGEVSELVSRVVEFFEWELEDWKDGVVVVEDFILRTADKRRKTMDPIRVTHALEGVLRDRGWRGELVLQQPSAAKSVVTDDRLRRWGLWIVGKPHGRDAVRHAVIYLRSIG